MKVYIAAPKAELSRAKWAAKWLRRLDFEVVSRWHDLLDEGAKDPEDFKERAGILRDNDADLERADTVLALTSEEGRETFIEIGQAVARRLMIVWSLQNGGKALSTSRINVQTALTDDDALDVLYILSRDQ